MSTRPRLTLAAAAAFVAALAAGPAAADTVKMLTTTYGHQSVDTSLTAKEAIGQYQGQLNGKTFLTYCTDVFEPFAFNTTYTDYFVAATGSANGFTAKQADLLGKLYTVADNGASAKVDSLNETVAFQLAVWEIVNETSSKLSITNDSNRGLFYVQSGATSEQMSLANSWLGKAQAATSSSFQVTRLASKGHQDFLTVSQVPEPSTYALMCAGLGAMAWVARRRRAV